MEGGKSKVIVTWREEEWILIRTKNRCWCAYCGVHRVTSFQQEAILGGSRASSTIRSCVRDRRGSRDRKWSVCHCPSQGEPAPNTGGGDPLRLRRESQVLWLKPLALAVSFGERAEWNFQNTWAVMGVARQSPPQSDFHRREPREAPVRLSSTTFTFRGNFCFSPGGEGETKV